MKLNSDIPSSVSFGGRSCWVRYRGQPRTCLKCGEAGHEAKECGVIRCFNCQSLGHASKECEVPTTCTICGKSGHHYRDCPVSFANKIKPNSSWIIGSHAKTSEGGEKEAEANLGEEVVEVSSDDATHSAIASNPGPSFMADSQPPNEVVSDKQTNDSQILLFEDSEPVVIPDTQASSDVVTDKKSSESEMDISDGRPEIKTLENCIPQPQLQDNETCSNEIQSQPAMSVDKDPIFVKPRRKASSQHDTGRRPERSRSGIRFPLENPMDVIKMTQIFLEDEPWHSCYVKTCCETFSKFNDLKAHVGEHHSKLKPQEYSCARRSCHLTFSTPWEWIQHLARKHAEFVSGKEIEFFDKYFLRQ
ncbi:Zinc finger CCHC domain-containing protein 3 [Holothuria leucospilota]|uniref:Zinc finger CCHC domain-containing protein 3 n=1 Tax=Holothuria leucospilota TaxID=206669 RepID=A0A9Q1HI48_HOLLE|nr:Zinc finger CCHC domain-containing protein 3 [Holothuria leucospilota]